MSEYLHNYDSLTIIFCSIYRAWPGASFPKDIQGLTLDLDSLVDTPLYSIYGISPKEAI